MEGIAHTYQPLIEARKINILTPTKILHERIFEYFDLTLGIAPPLC
jgi:hypothetical protein